MPLEYSGVLKEHAAVRDGVGVFDVSHLGKALVRGPGAADFVNACLTNDLGRIHPGKAQYTLCCNNEGGVIDDIIAYLRSDDEVFLIPNASNNTEVVAKLSAAAPDGIEVINQHRDFAVLAVQGTRSDELLSALGLPVGHEYMSYATGSLAGAQFSVCRTGYTGERGYELVVPAAAAGEVWDELFRAGEEYGLVPAGLGARDTLRTDMGYALHGHELSPSISPVMAGVSWAVGWSKPAFWGKAALEAQREADDVRHLVGLKAQGRGIPRPEMSVLFDGAVVGELTSGTFSPTLRVGIGLALVDPKIQVGDAVTVDVRGRQEAFDVVKPPFLKPSTKES
jgi:aminomethyltransferase